MQTSQRGKNGFCLHRYAITCIFEPAKLAIEAGFHVVCDKPVTFSLDEAKELKKLVKKHKTIFALTHNYTGYPMVKEARGYD
ncbi:MAG: Gfo/Idh/MocA family oxidoreductase [Saprospiraceae bacterium]